LLVKDLNRFKQQAIYWIYDFDHFLCALC